MNEDLDKFKDQLIEYLENDEGLKWNLSGHNFFSIEGVIEKFFYQLKKINK